MVSDLLTSTEYWTDIQITRQDVEFLHNYLFEYETPLTAHELVSVFIEERIRAEQDSLRKRREAGGKIYLPRETFQVGDHVIFPALGWKHGKVAEVRLASTPRLAHSMF